MQASLPAHLSSASKCPMNRPSAAHGAPAAIAVRFTTHLAHIASNGEYERTTRGTIGLRRTLRFPTVNGHAVVGRLSGSGLQARQDRAAEDDDGDSQYQHDGRHAARVGEKPPPMPQGPQGGQDQSATGEHQPDRRIGPELAQRGCQATPPIDMGDQHPEVTIGTSGSANHRSGVDASCHEIGGRGPSPDGGCAHPSNGLAMGFSYGWQRAAHPTRISKDRRRQRRGKCTAEGPWAESVCGTL